MAATRRPAGTAPSVIKDLDLLMFRLRFDFAYRCGGWMPTMGKNRYVDSIETLGEIGGGGVALGEIGGGGGGTARVLGEIGGGGDGEARYAEIELPFIRASDAGDGLRIGMLDTAVRNHKEFRAAGSRIEPLTGTPGHSDMAAHGTFGAGLILRHAPRAQLIVSSVLDDNGEAEVWDVAREMVSFLDDDKWVHILHMPWGAVTDDGEQPLVLATALELLGRRGITLVAAAGNHGNSTRPDLPPTAAVYPAAHPTVVAVAAEDRKGSLARFSPDPAELPWIRLTERGVKVVSTYLDDKYAEWSGSSFAAANFTGRLAASANGPGAIHDRLASLLDAWLERE
jgi:hypothetical protein